MNDWLEWLGYLASLIVLVSLLMSSIIRLRWVNLLGSSIFSLYGFLLGALPVGIMNLGIAIINIYYLVKLYNYTEYFKILPIENDSMYYKHFLKYYDEEMKKYSQTKSSRGETDVAFYILRNMVPAGLFMGTRLNKNTLRVDVDFVVPEFRDFKIARYVFTGNKDFFLTKGYTKLVSYSNNKHHIKYLIKVGFKESTLNDHKCYIKTMD